MAAKPSTHSGIPPVEVRGGCSKDLCKSTNHSSRAGIDDPDWCLKTRRAVAHFPLWSKVIAAAVAYHCPGTLRSDVLCFGFAA